MSRQFKNTDALQKVANFFRINGYYTDAIPETPEYYEFWRREKKRCLKGFKAGGIFITGYHYFYLNYSRMDRVDDDTLLKFVTSKDDKLVGVEKIEDFPAFWDGDYDYFFLCHRIVFRPTFQREIARQHGCIFVTKSFTTRL